jgi:hypothetical protein
VSHIHGATFMSLSSLGKCLSDVVASARADLSLTMSSFYACGKHEAHFFLHLHVRCILLDESSTLSVRAALLFGSSNVTT